MPDVEDDVLMDDALWHLESIREKGLPVDEIAAYNHLAIYLRWCIEHDLMDGYFLTEHSELVRRVKSDPLHTDLRVLIRDECDGVLLRCYFNGRGETFSWYYYYGVLEAPNFPSDIDDYALRYFGPARYHSNEFQQEAYLFIPYDEDYYQAMAAVIQERWNGWMNQEFSNTPPSELAVALMRYLNCKCQYFPPMKDDDPLVAAYGYARRLGVREGYIPMLITVDENLWECLVMNSDQGSMGEKDYAFNAERVAAYRKKVLAQTVKDGKAVLNVMQEQRMEEAEDDEMDWEGEIVGKMEGGSPNGGFLSFWDYDAEKTTPVILAEIPVKHPWEVFAYLPFGEWNECPGTAELMAVAKYWYQQYGAVPALMSHDELEFVLPEPIPKERAMELAKEQYGFCPDVLEQLEEDANVGMLADTLWQSRMWYFWWD